MVLREGNQRSETHPKWKRSAVVTQHSMEGGALRGDSHVGDPQRNFLKGEEAQ